MLLFGKLCMKKMGTWLSSVVATGASAKTRPKGWHETASSNRPLLGRKTKTLLLPKARRCLFYRQRDKNKVFFSGHIRPHSKFQERNRILRKICRSIIGAIVLLLMMTGGSGASLTPSPTITVTPWLAPNVFGSPSFAAAQTNAVNAMYYDVSSYGTPGTPAFFQAQTTPVTSAENIVTGFPSWLGQADPGTVFGPAFASELGNRMTFAVRIVGNGTKFSIDQLSFSATSTDPGNALAFGFPAGSYTYGPAYEGVLAGPDGILGTPDDVFITSGPASQLVDELVGRGSGNSFAAYCSSCSVSDEQAAIDLAAAYPGTPYSFTGTYSIGNASGSGTFVVTPAPEPRSALVLVTALCGLLEVRRRRKSNQYS
jgi:hypothetical protein